jgi:hypothetical protein
LDRLKVLVGLRKQWSKEISEVRRLRDWLLDTEHILAGEWAQAEEGLTNENVAQRFDIWCAHLADLAATESLSENEQSCLSHFLKITQGLRPHLIQCYDRQDFPRTNNAMEGYIRSVKTRYRRISGRKNWNGYLLRYGRCVAYYDWLEQEQISQVEIEEMLQRVGHQQWRDMRQQGRNEQCEQLKMYRFRHKRERYLLDLETRWDQIDICTGLLH